MKRFEYHCKIPKVMDIGRHCNIHSPIVKCWNSDIEIYIGSFCSIANGAVFLAGGEHPKYYVSTCVFPPDWKAPGLPKSNKGNIIIGNDVWIGENARILSGSVIEDGAIIGNSAVISGYVPPYAIMIGNPAKILKFRFSDFYIKQLIEKINWWNWSDEKIKENIHLFNDIDKFVETHGDFNGN